VAWRADAVSVRFGPSVREYGGRCPVLGGGKWPTFAGGMDDMDARWRHADLTALLLTLTRPTDRQLREVIIMIDEDR